MPHLSRSAYLHRTSCRSHSCLSTCPSLVVLWRSDRIVSSPPLSRAHPPRYRTPSTERTESSSTEHRFPRGSVSQHHALGRRWDVGRPRCFNSEVVSMFNAIVNPKENPHVDPVARSTKRWIHVDHVSVSQSMQRERRRERTTSARWVIQG